MAWFKAWSHKAGKSCFFASAGKPAAWNRVASSWLNLNADNLYHINMNGVLPVLQS